jgi:hypothetical protein
VLSQAFVFDCHVVVSFSLPDFSMISQNSTTIPPENP